MKSNLAKVIDNWKLPLARAYMTQETYRDAVILGLIEAGWAPADAETEAVRRLAELQAQQGTAGRGCAEVHMKPLHDRVLIKRKNSDTITKGGLHIPTAAQEKSNLAEVVAIGTGRISESGTVVPLKVEPGMTVLIGKWAGDTVMVADVEHLIVREADILAVIDG